MSEEEIIEIIEKLQCEYKEQENEKKYNDYTVFKAKEYSKGLQGLLALYQKEKQKNKELEDKIKGKIEELDKKEQERINKITNSIELYPDLIYISLKNILLELLEERN